MIKKKEADHVWATCALYKNREQHIEYSLTLFDSKIKKKIRKRRKKYKGPFIDLEIHENLQKVLASNK